MSSKTRLATVILSGLLLGLVAVKLQRSAVPIETSVLSEDNAVRNQALQRLESLRDNDEKSRIVGEIAKEVKSPNPRKRVFALYALRKSGWKDPRVIGAIMDGLNDPNAQVREEAEVGIREEGSAALSQMIWYTGNPAIRQASRDLGPTLTPDAVPELETALQGSGGQPRGAAFFLSQISRPDTLAAARHLAPTLAATMASTDTALAINSAFALNTLDPKDPRPYPVFMKSLRQENWDALNVRGDDALNALVKAPEYKERILPFLKSALATAPDGWINGRRFKRPAIGDALNALAPMPAGLPALVDMLKSPSPSARWRAVYAIGSAPTVDEEAFSPLVHALDDRDQVVAARAVWALDRLGPEKAERAADTVYPKLIDTFQRITAPVPGFWMSAMHAIAGLGARALPLTFDAVRTGRLAPDKASSIVRALSEDAEPTAYLKTALADPNPDVRLVAALGLSKFEPTADGVQRELQANLARQKGLLHDDIQRTLDGLARKTGNN